MPLKALYLLLFPVFEFFFLRVYLHSYLKLQIGYSGMTDYDFVCPSIIAFILMIALMDSRENLKLRFNRTGAILNITLFSLFLITNHHYSSLNAFSIFSSFWVVLAISTILSSLFVWMKPSVFWNHSYSFLIWPAAAAGISKVAFRHVLAPLWDPLTKATGLVACATVSPILGDSLTCEFDFVSSGATYQRLLHPNFGLAIGSGCGGMEGISFVLFMCLLVLMVKRTPLRIGSITA